MARSFTNAFFMSSRVTDEWDLLCRLLRINEHVKSVQPNFSWTLFLNPDRLSVDVRKRSKEICLKAGFTYTFDFKCMQAMKLLAPVRSLPTAEIKFATSEQEIYEAMLLNVEAFNRDHVFITDRNKQFCCVVYVNDKPVSTARTFVLDECLYVH